jgi:hypothetical protein
MSSLATTVSVVTLPDGSRIVESRIVLPKNDDISNLRQFEVMAQEATNAIRQKVMQLGLAAFDTEGEPIIVGKTNFTKRQRSPATYRTIFGPVDCSRYLYQSSLGGTTYVPLEDRGRILHGCTPNLASIIASRYSEQNGEAVERSLKETNRIKIDKNLVQAVAAEVGKVALSKEEHWSYRPAVEPALVATIGLGVDGALAPILHHGEWKQAMVGSIALYDALGEVLSITYVAKAPLHKEKFVEALEKEIARYKSWYPDALWVGLSDGASDLRILLVKHCIQLILDFYHAAEYLLAALLVMQPEETTKEEKAEQAAKALHELKHMPGGAETLLKRMQKFKLEQRRITKRLKPLTAAITYFENNLDRMDYAAALAENLPIASGVTEAACKSLIKARFCGNGMRWHDTTMDQVLSLRVLRQSGDRWTKFWSKIERNGY